MQRKQDRRASVPDKRIGASDDDIVDVFTQRLTEPQHLPQRVHSRRPLPLHPPSDYLWDAAKPPLHPALFERFGSYYNGNLNDARVRWRYRANERLSFDFSQQWNKFQLPVPDARVSGTNRNRTSFARLLLSRRRRRRWARQ